MASGLTPIYSIPYPLPTDSVNVSGDIQSLANIIDNVLSTKIGTFSPSLTGIPTAPTASVDTNTIQIATTQFVINQGYLKSANASTLYAPIISPNLTGVPLAPTAPIDTNTTQIATTEFVINQGYAKNTDIAATYATKGYVNNVSLNVKTGSYTIQLSDVGTVIELNSSTAVDLVIPEELTANFDIGATLDIVQIGAGQITITPFNTNVTVQANGGGLKLRGQYSAASIYKRASNTWIAMGDLST